MARIAFIGMGEAGSARVAGWGKGVHEVTAFDRKTNCRESRPEVLVRYADLGVEGCESYEHALAGARLVMSVVISDKAVNAATAAHLDQGAYFCDLNSCAPSSKRISADRVHRTGAC